MEVNIDYPEYDDVEDATTEFLLEQSKEIKQEINRLLDTGAQAKLCVKVYLQLLLVNQT